MAALVLRVNGWVARHRVRVLAAGVVIGVVGGLAMALVAGVRRTESAPDRYTQHAGGDPDLFVTQFSGSPLIDEVAALPGVASTDSWVFVTSFLVSPVDGAPVLEPNPFAGDDDAL